MWIFIDIAIVFIIALCTFLGYKRGLIGVIFKIVSFIVAIILSLILVIPVSNVIINNTKIEETLQDTIYSKLMQTDSGEVKTEDVNNSSQIIVNYINGYTSEIKDIGAKSIANKLSTTAIKVITFIILFIVIRLILMIFRALLDALAEIPIIKQFNKLGGTLYGILKALIILYAIFAVLSLLAPMISNTGVFTAINESYLGSFMYNKNVLLMLLF